MHIRCLADGSLMVQKHESNGSAKKQQDGRLPDHFTGRFLQDGGGHLLMRYLVTQKYIGKIETYFMNITGRYAQAFWALQKNTLRLPAYFS